MPKSNGDLLKLYLMGSYRDPLENRMQRIFMAFLFVILFSCSYEKKEPVSSAPKQTEEKINYQKSLPIKQRKSKDIDEALPEVSRKNMKKLKRRKLEMRPIFENAKRENLNAKSSYDQYRIQFLSQVRDCLGKEKVRYFHPEGKGSGGQHARNIYSVKRNGTDLRLVLDQDEIFQFGWLESNTPITRSNNGRFLAFRLNYVKKGPKNIVKGLEPYLKALPKWFKKVRHPYRTLALKNRGTDQSIFAWDDYDPKKTAIQNTHGANSIIEDTDTLMGVLYDLKMNEFYELGIVMSLAGRENDEYSVFTFSRDSKFLLFKVDHELEYKSGWSRCHGKGQQFALVDLEKMAVKKKFNDRCREELNLSGKGLVLSAGGDLVKVIAGNNGTMDKNKKIDPTKQKGIRTVSLLKEKLVKEEKIFPEYHWARSGHSNDGRYITVVQQGNGCSIIAGKCRKVFDTKTKKLYPFEVYLATSSIHSNNNEKNQADVYFYHRHSLHRLLLPSMEWELILDGMSSPLGPQVYNEEILDAQK